MQATSTQQLLQPKPKPADPFDPKQLLAAQNSFDPSSSNTNSSVHAPKAAGTGLQLDMTA